MQNQLFGLLVENARAIPGVNGAAAKKARAFSGCKATEVPVAFCCVGSVVVWGVHSCSWSRAFAKNLQAQVPGFSGSGRPVATTAGRSHQTAEAKGTHASHHKPARGKKRPETTKARSAPGLVRVGVGAKTGRPVFRRRRRYSQGPVSRFLQRRAALDSLNGALLAFRGRCVEVQTPPPDKPDPRAATSSQRTCFTLNGAHLRCSRAASWAKPHAR